jgi:cold shock CspA family protein
LESGLQELNEGQKVSYQPIEETKGLKATEISAIE